MQPLRITIQLSFLLFILYLGLQFYRFIQNSLTGGPILPRPAGIEGFLPISGLLGLREWIETGSLNPVHPAAIIILVCAIVVSLAFRRSFCSFICPVGTISEVGWKWGFSLFRRNFRLPKPLDFILRSIKYLLLAFFIGSIFLLMDHEQVQAFITSDYHRLADYRLLKFFLYPSTTLLVILGVLLLFSLLVRNPFCRYLCPYGALLGFASFLSPFAVRRRKDLCISCGACNSVCPSRLPIMEKSRVSSPECIGCWRCISYCKADGALHMSLFPNRWIISGLVFALLVVGFFYGGTVIGKVTGHWQADTTAADYHRLLQ
jgi:polyferredoxin